MKKQKWFSVKQRPNSFADVPPPPVREIRNISPVKAMPLIRHLIRRSNRRVTGNPE